MSAAHRCGCLVHQDLTPRGKPPGALPTHGAPSPEQRHTPLARTQQQSNVSDVAVCRQLQDSPNSLGEATDDVICRTKCRKLLRPLIAYELACCANHSASHVALKPLRRVLSSEKPDFRAAAASESVGSCSRYSRAALRRAARISLAGDVLCAEKLRCRVRSETLIVAAIVSEFRRWSPHPNSIAAIAF